MSKNAKEEKEKIKEAINKNIDKYFETIESLKSNDELDINEIERLWKKERGSIEELLRTGTEQAVNTRETGCKKNNVRSVLGKIS